MMCEEPGFGAGPGVVFFVLPPSTDTPREYCHPATDSSCDASLGGAILRGPSAPGSTRVTLQGPERKPRRGPSSACPGAHRPHTTLLGQVARPGFSHRRCLG